MTELTAGRLLRCFGALLDRHVAEPVLGQNDFNAQGFRWISCHDTDANLIAYLRQDVAEQTLLAIVGHFGGAAREYRIGVPRHGYWREMINTNSSFYGGSGVGNDGGRNSEEVPRDGFGQSILVTLPPHTTVIFKWSV